jgi:hypothetical protein
MQPRIDALGGDNVEPRKELSHLTKNMPFHGQIANRASIERIVDYWGKQDADKLKQMANHFTFFDPGNPDYSYLYGKQPA